MHMKMYIAAVNPESKTNFLIKSESWWGVDETKCWHLEIFSLILQAWHTGQSFWLMQTNGNNLISQTFILQGFPPNFPLAQTLQLHQATAVAYFSDIIWSDCFISIQNAKWSFWSENTFSSKEQCYMSHLFSKRQTNTYQMITCHDYPDDTYSVQ